MGRERACASQGSALVLAGASLWGLIGLFNRTLMGAGLSPRSIVLVRNLQAVGDVKFPVALGILSQWIVGVGIAWLFGIYLGWGLVGIWMAFALDENLRAVLFIIRWKAGKWRSIKTV